MIVRRAGADPAAIRRLLEALPDWFGDRASLEEYVADAERMTNYVALDGETVVGAVLLNQHFTETSEIHLIAVDPAWHRRGVGRALLAAVESDLIAQGARLLEVKTIGPSADNAPYAETRKFYAGMGFLPVEELRGDDSPVSPWPFLILVKPL